ncbi:MAG TPA: Ig-like domain-containing protein, partial [Cytophaga sp.]|nr:Ig-like domain-containing protein [Cytophaga sp.]
ATQLTATGTALKWYADNTTTTALVAAPTPVTTATGTTSYFVSQTTNGCESPRAQIAVTVNALPAATITAGSATTFCNGGSVTLTASTGSSYVWKNGTTQVGTNATYAATAAGSYTVEVTNANNCKATSAATVVTINTSGNAPAVTATAVYCQNATATQLTATGTALKWYADNTTTTALSAAPTPVTTATGTTSYFVSQTTSGCESPRAQIAVTVNPLPTATITAGSATTFCNGGSVTLTASTGSSYVWKNGTTQVGTNATYAATAAGSYTVEVTNANNCKATSAATVVTLNAPPAAPAVSATATYCQNAVATQLTATGTALKWYADNTTTTALAAAPTPSTTDAGTTTYYVSQTNGCESPRAQITVTVNAAPTAVITPASSTVLQAGGSVVLNANTGSGLSYKWLNGSVQVGTDASYTAGAVGSYVVEVTNGSDCKATSLAVDVTSAANRPSIITITSPTTDATITGTITITANITDPDGTIALVEYLDGSTVIGTATSQPYSFDWTNPTTGNHVITIRVTDSNGGITTSAPVTITSNATTTTGVNSSTSISATVYPNPSNGDLYVETDMDLSAATFTVINVLGEEAILSASVNSNGARLDVSGLTEGAYVLIITEGSSVIRKKITVMK